MIRDLVPGTEFGWHPHDCGIALTLTPEATRTLAELTPAPGQYRWPDVPGLSIEIEPRRFERNWRPERL